MMLIEGPTSEIPTHKPGFVVVASGSKGFVALTGGTRLTWGERVFGKYSQFYNVDVGLKTLTFPKFQCASSQAGLNFEVTIQLTIQIVDPARAVVQGLGDPSEILAHPARRVAESNALQFKVDSVIAAKQTIDAAALGIVGDPAIRIVGASAEVQPDDRAFELLRKIAEENLVREANAAQARVNDAKRDAIVKLLDSPNDLLAQSIVCKDDTFREALNFKLEQYANDRRQQIELLKLLIDTNVIEPHDIHERFRGVLDLALEALRPPTQATAPLPPGRITDNDIKE